MSRIYFYDTTLRDGSQGEGVVFSVDDKIRIAKKLDALGIDYIEGGWPGSNPRDLEFFRKANNINFRHAKLAAFGSTKRAGNCADQDLVLQNLLAANTPVVAIFGKSWGFQVENVLRISPEENLNIIEDSVRFLKSNGKEVVYDAEHFFDGYKANPSYALDSLKAALRGGADALVLCDTNGGTLPLDFMEIFQAVQKSISAPIGVHIHNDSGMAAAISIIAAQQGAIQIQGTFNGYGERCGNANLTTIIPSLLIKLGFNSPVKSNLTLLT